MTQGTIPANTTDQHLLKIGAARVLASQSMPYLSHVVYAMVPVKVEGLGTFASDAKWRMYWDPEVVDKWTVEELSGVVLHEAYHCFLGHGPRFSAMNEPKRFAPIFNVAGDGLINVDLRDASLALPEGAVYVDALPNCTREMSAEQVYRVLIDANCTCDDHSQDSGDSGDEQTAEGDGQDSDNQDGQGGQSGDEQDSDNQNGQGGQSGDEQDSDNQNGQGGQSGDEQDSDNQNGQGGQSGDEQDSDNQNGQGGQSGDEQDSDNQNGQGGGKDSCPVHGQQNGQGGQSGDEQGEGSPGAGQGWDCGSAADGVTRDYEAEGDKVDAGVDEARGDLIRQQAAVEIVRHSKNRGDVPGGLLRAAREIVEPVVDWRKELAALVRRQVALVKGRRDYTYSRPSRRQAGMLGSGQNVILPGMRDPSPPTVAVVIDTSGSMSDEMLQWAVGETQGVLRSTGSHDSAVTLYSCDAHATEAQRIRSVSQIELKGGGGTDMRVGIEAAMAAKPAPDAVVVITDGYTPWPDEPLANGAVLICALTDEGAKDSVPAFAKTVMVTR